MLRTLLSVIFQNLSFIMVLYELMNELKSRDARSIMRSGVTQLGTFRRYLIRYRLAGTKAYTDSLHAP